MASFGSATFDERPDGGFDAPVKVQSAKTIYHIPGSNTNVRVGFGRLARTIQIPISCTESEATALYAAVGDDATLTWGGGSSSATLEAVELRQWAGVADYYQGTIEVTIL